MELKAGYKQTDVGVIPEDWEAVSLDTVCSMKSGEGITSAGIDDFSSYPCYGGNGLRGFTTRYTHDGTYALIGRVGALCGNVVAAEGQFFASEHAIVVSARPGVNIRWFTYVLGRMHLNQYSESSAQPCLSVSKVLKLPLVFPLVEIEQTAIATALSDTDELIRSLDQLIAKKLDIKQATMQQLLTGKKRLAGFMVKDGYRPTDFGKIPNDWKLITIREALAKGRLGGNYVNQDTETMRPLIKMGNISRGYIDISKIEYIPNSTLVDEDHRLHYGDVLFNTRNTLELVGKVAIWRDEAQEAYYNSNIMRLEFNDDKIASSEYVNYAFNTKLSIDRLRAIATGTTSVAAIYTRDLMQFLLPIPSKPEQVAIANVLSDMDADITEIETKRDKTIALKQGMMQELLTGRIRLTCAM